MSREILLVTHTGRDVALAYAQDVARELVAAGIGVLVPEDEAAELDVDGVSKATISDDGSVAGNYHLVVVVGGDGTILRGVERSRGSGAPVLGVNLGHVGFLAEAEAGSRREVIDAIIHERYVVRERLAIQVSLTLAGEVLFSTWALNEMTLEKSSRQKMLEVGVAIDGQELSEWGCDGIICATPTGSTAYAFSAGGPVVWPDVEALLVVPLSAHALFARPLVVAPDGVVSIRLLERTGTGVLFADGRRSAEVPPGAVIEVTRSAEPVRFARLHAAPFTGRLVAKFNLPVTGWRGQ